ncbi:PDR/VanB family oxidoreductase [Cognatishimia sp. WU-CL00825]|uniref:PDR/VanB family oxidoreductase n=1 Tax=Cognatishimia sp. WU-CL00825 TaxID=3127658 RepID=UPI00310889B9
MTLINVKVAKIKREAEGVHSFLLAKTGLFKFPKYAPGAHIDVHCGEGIIRQYSLCGDPEDRRHLMVAVKHEERSRGGSELMHTKVEVGQRLEIGSPRNNFHLDEAASYAILLAAGIGITPIIAMADRLYKLGIPFELQYFSRAETHTAFRKRLVSGDYAQNVTFHEGLDPAQTGDALDHILSAPKRGGQVYMCGPGVFMEAAESRALKHWPSDAVKLERFAANPAFAGLPTSKFTIELARSGIALEVGKDETILDVLEANDINAAFSCEQGVCGTCVTDIIEGKAEHRDSFLSEKERARGDKLCLCVSRAKGERLVIDI